MASNREITTTFLSNVRSSGLISVGAARKRKQEERVKITMECPEREGDATRYF